MSASLRSFTPADIRARLPELGALLQDCVHDGASIGFILPFDVAASQAFWIILKCGFRAGDNAPMAYVELVDRATAGEAVSAE